VGEREENSLRNECTDMRSERRKRRYRSPGLTFDMNSKRKGSSLFRRTLFSRGRKGDIFLLSLSSRKRGVCIHDREGEGGGRVFLVRCIMQCRKQEKGGLLGTDDARQNGRGEILRRKTFRCREENSMTKVPSDEEKMREERRKKLYH